jgi:hypothetical protein
MGNVKSCIRSSLCSVLAPSSLAFDNRHSYSNSGSNYGEDSGSDSTHHSRTIIDSPHPTKSADDTSDDDDVHIVMVIAPSDMDVIEDIYQIVPHGSYGSSSLL